jgi:hypothetical protein
VPAAQQPPCAAQVAGSQLELAWQRPSRQVWSRPQQAAQVLGLAGSGQSVAKQSTMKQPGPLALG